MAYLLARACHRSDGAGDLLFDALAFLLQIAAPAGYYSPASAPLVRSGRMLLLAHANTMKPEITPRRLEDDQLMEV
jgi:hypothetical protein